MLNPVRDSILVTVTMLAVASLVSVPAKAQTYNPPRMADGKPDLNGIWQVLNTAAWDIEDHSAQMGIPAGQGVVEGGAIPYQPWAAAHKKENHANRKTADPWTRCYLPGVPRMMYLPLPFQIVQTPKYIAMLSEYTHTTRIIYTDGSQHLEGDLDFWMGDSRGRWDGDVLVVDAIHFTGQTWFDKAGNFHSDQLHVVERFTRTGPDHVRYEVTIKDPKVFTRPWKMSMPLYRRVEKDVQLLEYECVAFLEEERETGRKN